jgi:hypothetical protein
MIHYLCQICGAVVGDTVKHDEFHNSLKGVSADTFNPNQKLLETLANE